VLSVLLVGYYDSRSQQQGLPAGKCGEHPARRVANFFCWLATSLFLLLLVIVVELVASHGDEESAGGGAPPPTYTVPAGSPKNCPRPILIDREYQHSSPPIQPTGFSPCTKTMAGGRPYQLHHRRLPPSIPLQQFHAAGIDLEVCFQHYFSICLKNFYFIMVSRSLNYHVCVIANSIRRKHSFLRLFC
jgi:hypothetical protein